MTDDSPSQRLDRMPTGIAGLDGVLRGGFFRGGIYIVRGPPGAGKTVLANQICAHFVRAGGRAVYVTLLAEAHGRMLAHLETMSFFDWNVVGRDLKYLDGVTPTTQEGLPGLLKLARAAVREQDARLLVLDGMVTAGAMASSELELKKFIQELQAWVGLLGCTVLFLTSGGNDGTVKPEHTMVDGILELNFVTDGMRVLRQARVSKFRGSGFSEGCHPYEISDRGITLYPRIEASLKPKLPVRANAPRLSLRTPGLDRLIGGGVRSGSTTLVIGSSGAGKTVLGLQFLAAGLDAQERVVHYGFYENPGDLIAKAERLGWKFQAALSAGLLEIKWRPPAEHVLDELGYELLETVRSTGAKRLLIDGLVGFKAAAYRERLPAFFAVLVEQLSALGVTTLITEETRELFVREIEVPTPGVSAIFHNIIFLRHVEKGAQLLRLLAVMKTRDSGYDRGLYEFAITDRGLELGERFSQKQTLLMGVADDRRQAGHPNSGTED